MHVAVVVPTLSFFFGLAETLESVRTTHQWTPKIMPNWRTGHCLSKAWNDGIDAMKDSDYILVVNDDILFSKYTIDNLVQFFEEMPDDVVMVTGRNLKAQIGDKYNIFGYKPESLDYGENPDFSCFMVRPTIFDMVGRFDENFVPAYFEDNDFHYRIKLAGLRALNYGAAPYYHIGSQTQCDPYKFESNRAYYVKKWGGNPGQEVYTEPFGGSA